MANPAFRAAGTKTNGTGGQSSISVAPPAGIVAGDLLVLVATCYQSVTITTPTGWTLLKDSGGYATLSRYRSYVFYKIAGASETNVTVALTSGADFIDGQMFAVQDVDTSAPLDAAGVQGAVSTSTSVATPALTTATANALMVYIGFDTGGAAGNVWTTPPAGATERSESTTNIGRFIWADETKVVAGLEAADTYTRTNAQAALIVGFAVKPSAGGGGGTFVPQITVVM